MKINGILVSCAALALIGCQGGSATLTTSSGTLDAGQAKNDAAVKTPTPPPAPASVPDELKSDAYHYYGLANENPMKVKISGPREASGTQQFHLKSVEGGKATFEMERTGALADQFGTETVSLEKDGIYTIASTQVNGALHNIELPANLPVGATWKNSDTLKQTNGETIEQNVAFKVVGPEEVTTEAGKQQALLITASGTMKLGSQTFRMNSRMWYVKDRGLVKSVFNMVNGKDPKAKPQVITIQETK